MKRKLNELDVPEPVETGNSPQPPPPPPPPQATFSSLGLDSRLRQAVDQEKFASPTPVQLQVIPAALAGKDIVARAKTGSGKTLAYLLPILNAILRRKSGNKRARSTTALILVPKKELATQVSAAIRTFASFCAQEVKCYNIIHKEDAAVTRAKLSEEPDVVVASPAGAIQWINDRVLKTEHLKHLVIDEADCVLSYEYGDDLGLIAKALPSGVQKIMMSATLRTDEETLRSMFFPNSEDSPPTVINLSEQEAAEKATLGQFVIRTAEDEKFLMIYAIFKLGLIKGKFIIFVADIDRCYRVKLFLEQIAVRSCVLNSELPVNSRSHVIEEFNRGVYNIIIAADKGDGEVMGNEGRRKKKTTKHEPNDTQSVGNDNEGGDDEDQEAGDPNRRQTGDVAPAAAKKQRNTGKKSREDREYGVSRGIDFRHVTCVLNFDMPSTSNSYTHRIGRTARAGQAGRALTFYVPTELYRKHKSTSIPQCAEDEKALARIRSDQAKKGQEIKQWDVDYEKLVGLRYRLADALRSVTNYAVRRARLQEVEDAIKNSAKLERYFEENPEVSRHLRHDRPTHVVRQQAHLKHIPSYLLPSGGKAALTEDVGFVGMRKDKDNRIRKARAFNKSRGKGRIAKTKGLDPLRSLNVKGRGKK